MNHQRPQKIVVLGGVIFEDWGRSVRTILPDGAVVVGAPQDNDSYRATARRLGYGTHVALQNRDHELCHSLLSALLGLRMSPTLAGVARGEEPDALRHAEEAMVLATQKFARMAGVDLMDAAARLGAAVPDDRL
jgi:hypothetical protein